MNDDRFIELLNLYIDQQITAAEAQELEAELVAQPARQKVYHQYCQIHRATVMVGAQFQRPPADTALAARISQLRQQTRSTPGRAVWRSYASGLAAACLAVFFLRFDATKTVPAEPMVTPAVAMTPVAAPQSGPVAVVVETKPVETARPAYISLKTIPVTDTQDYVALLSALRREERLVYGEAPLDPTKQPSLFEDGVFESPRYWQENRTRDFRSRVAPGAQQAEFTGFQFQR
jgi:hypothetical protein